VKSYANHKVIIGGVGGNEVPPEQLKEALIEALYPQTRTGNYRRPAIIHQETLPILDVVQKPPPKLITGRKPADAQLNLPLDKSGGKREVVLDTETTGLRALKGDRIVEIGCVELNDGIPTGKTFQAYLNPERDVPPQASAVHGLTTEFLADKPTFK